MTDICRCTDAMELAQLLAAGVALADRLSVDDIVEHATQAGRTSAGRRIYDLRPMLDPREQTAETLEMARQAVAWARARGLIAPADRNPDVVVLLKPGV